MKTEEAYIPAAEALEAAHWTKSISFERDQRQSQTLTGLVSFLLLAAALRYELSEFPGWAAFLLSVGVSIALAVGAWLLRASLPTATLLGAVVCVLLFRAAAPGVLIPGLPAGVAALAVLVALTFLATRYRSQVKKAAGLAEPRLGRRASQIAANLGIAGLCAAAGLYPSALAALAEAGADTISSEIGQALGGRTILITTLRRVAPGTDGGISVIGTLAGLLASALIVFAGSAKPIYPPLALRIFLAGIVGLLVDSLLGATLERRGILGNDLVNFVSTAASALLTFALWHP